MVPDDLLNEIRETAKLTDLSVQEVFRQSVKIAKPVLRRLTRKERPKLLSVWDALSSGAGSELRVTPMDATVEKVSL